jgi:hypothetical protein
MVKNKDVKLLKRDEINKVSHIIVMFSDTRCGNIIKFASEQTHIIENFGFWINATEPKSQHWTSEW